MATLGTNLLVTGPIGCDQMRLVETLHGISLLRSRKLVPIDRVPDRDRTRQREIIARAERSTLAIKIEEDAPMLDGTFASMLFSPGYQVRVVAMAPYASKARDVLGAENVRTMETIALRPLAARAGAIPQLLTRLFEERGSPLRLSDMTSPNQAALQAYQWPENFIDLRIAADRLVMIAREGSLRAAADALGQSRSSLQRWYTEQVGLRFPLVEEQRPA
jgi:hypothetical protein